MSNTTYEPNCHPNPVVRVGRWEKPLQNHPLYSSIISFELMIQNALSPCEKNIWLKTG
jgi:hypothetical protein